MFGPSYFFRPFFVDNLNKRTEIVCWHHPQRVNCLYLEKMSIKRIDVALGQKLLFLLCFPSILADLNGWTELVCQQHGF